MDYHCFLQGVAILLVTFSTVGSLDHTGTRFIVAFFRNLDVKHAYVLITPATKDITTASIFFTYQDGPSPLTLSLTPKKVKQIYVRLRSGSESKRIRIPYPVLKINTSLPVTITAVVEGVTSFSSYLVYPLVVAGTEFRMVPFCNTSIESLCTCDIVTTQENTNITLENNNNGNISIYTEEHAVNDHTFEYLSLPHSKRNIVFNQHSGFISLESNDDFSGLLLRTTHPVVVFCGGKKNDETMTMEQILPVVHFDKNFYSFPFDNAVMLTPSLRFVSHFNCTTISINSRASWILDAGQFQDEVIQSSDIWTIFSSKPIGLFQIFAGTNPLREYPSHYEEDMVMVPSVAQYVSSVTIPRRNKTNNSEKFPPIYMYMYIGLVYEVLYFIETSSGYDNLTTINKKVRREPDADGGFFTLKSPKVCRESKGKAFGAYSYRLSETDFSLSNVGVKFVTKNIERYKYEPCTKAGSNPTISSSRTTATTTTTATTELPISSTIRNLERTDTSTAVSDRKATFSESTSFQFDTVDKTNAENSVATVQCTCRPCDQPFTTSTTATSAETSASTTATTETSASTTATTETSASTTTTTASTTRTPVLTTETTASTTETPVSDTTTIADKTTTTTTTTGPPIATSPATKRMTSPTEDEIKEKIKEIKRALTIDKHTLSSYRRKKTSADDDRSSAKGIGVLGACVICAVISFIIVLDFNTFVHQGALLWKRAVGSSKRSTGKRCQLGKEKI